MYSGNKNVWLYKTIDNNYAIMLHDFLKTGLSNSILQLKNIRSLPIQSIQTKQSFVKVLMLFFKLPKSKGRVHFKLRFLGRG